MAEEYTFGTQKSMTETQYDTYKGLANETVGTTVKGKGVGAQARYLIDQGLLSEKDAKSILKYEKVDDPLPSPSEPYAFGKNLEKEPYVFGKNVKEDTGSFVGTPMTINDDGSIGTPSKGDAYRFGLKKSLKGVYDGIKQLLGVDTEYLVEQENMYNALSNDEELGFSAKAGFITGAVAEPIGFMLPGSKAATISKAAAQTGAIGGLYGALTYVDKDSTRLGNATIGLAGGAIVGGAVKTYRTIKETKAYKVLDDVELEWAKQISQGISPTDAQAALKEYMPSMAKDLKKALKITGSKPMLTLSKKEADQIVDHSTNLVKARDIRIGSATPDSTVLQTVGNGVDSVVGIMSTRIGNRSKRILGRARAYEKEILGETHKRLLSVDPFFTSAANKLDKANKVLLDKALINSDVDTIQRIIKSSGDEELAVQYKTMRDTLDTMGTLLQKSGRFKDKIENYFPRTVMNYEGLLGALGRTEKSLMERAMDKAEKDAAKKGRKLTPIQRSDVTNKVIRGFGPKLPAYKPGFAKIRTMDVVPDNLLKFYSSPEETIHTYIQNASSDLAKSTFFGKNIKYLRAEGSYKAIDLDDSIGRILDEEYQSGKITGTQATELAALLRVRFGVGEESTAGIIQDSKNIINAALLANPISAATQLGDLGTSVFINGLHRSLYSVAKSITGRSEIPLEDFGLVDNIAVELVSTRKSAKFLRWGFKVTGFRGIDRIGKETFINSSLNKYRKLSKSTKGRTRIAEKYEDVYGDDFSQLVDDLQSGKVTENVKLLMFNELSDVQPITKLETPEMYLRMPNGRVVYALKTFMLKQADIVRRESFQEIAKGNRAYGLWQLARYATIMGAAGAGANAVKDFIMGKALEAITPADIGANALKLFMWGEYNENQFNKGRGLQTLAIQAAIPPHFALADQLLSGGPKAMALLPGAGKLWFMHFGGGLEEFEDKKLDKMLEDIDN